MGSYSSLPNHPRGGQQLSPLRESGGGKLLLESSAKPKMESPNFARTYTYGSASRGPPALVPVRVFTPGGTEFKPQTSKAVAVPKVTGSPVGSPKSGAGGGGSPLSNSKQSPTSSPTTQSITGTRGFLPAVHAPPYPAKLDQDLLDESVVVKVVGANSFSSKSPNLPRLDSNKSGTYYSSHDPSNPNPIRYAVPVPRPTPYMMHSRILMRFLDKGVRYTSPTKRQPGQPMRTLTGHYEDGMQQDFMRRFYLQKLGQHAADTESAYKQSSLREMGSTHNFFKRPQK